VLLRPLPYSDVDRVVTLWETNLSAGYDKVEVAPGNFLEWSERSSSFESMALAEPFGFDLTAEGRPVSVPSWLVTEGFFETLGVKPILGRTFLPEEYVQNGPFVVMISHDLWRQRFGSDPSIVGRAIQVDYQAATVVGVLPPELEYPEPKDLWAPKWFRESETNNRTSTYMSAVARLRPGVTVGAAQADMDRIAATLAAEYPQTNHNSGVEVVPLADQILGPVRPALLVLLGAVGLVLLIACANVASLLLARGAERDRELGVRAALGAGRPRLMRQLMTESVLLALLGGTAGLILARLGVRVLSAVAPAELPRVDSIAVDGRVLVFALVITVLTVLLFGLAPSLRLSRPSVLSALRGSGRSFTAGIQRTQLRKVLVVAEIALALILLIGAGLLVRSFADLLDNDVGFITSHRVSLQLHIWDRNPTAEQRMQRVSEIEARMESMPGVEQVAVVTSLPFHPSRINAQGLLQIEGRPEPPPGQELRVFTTVASPEYFEVMGIPLVAGRGFSVQDRSDAPAVAIISEALSRRYFADANPIGQKVTIGVMSRPVTREIVGVVGDVRPTRLDSDPEPELFIPFLQSGTGSVTFVARTSGDPAGTLPALREQIWQIDPGQAIYHASTLDDLISETLVVRRFHVMLLASFSLIALILAAIGIYGLISFSTSRRTGEIGVRMALGARESDVVGMILREGVQLSLVGILLGVVGALLLTRFMAHMLYGVTPTDFPTFGILAAFMLAVSAAATYLPAYRAATADPVASLREE
jgi:putative ABC transport system permease protein